MALADFHSDIEFRKLAGSGFSVLGKNCSSKLKPGLDICCRDCGKYFRFKWQLNEHSRVHENKVHLKCHQCSATFIRTGDLNKHLNVHSSERPFKCKFCSKYFKTKPTKICHEDTHNQNTYNCRFCGETFKRYNHKNKHERTHRQAEIIKGENGMLKYKCMFCIGVFASHEFLEEHVLKAHKKKSTSNNRKIKPKIYKCSVCSLKLYTYKEHKTHIMDLHPNEFKNVFFETCKICLKKVSLSFLSYHMKAHEGVKPHFCTKCDAKFARRGELNKHMAVHNESKTYQCNWCEDILKCKQEYESHKLLHIGKKRFKCDECEATYHTSSNLRQHKKRWHIRNFAVCTICQKKVLTMDLNRHMKINHESNEKLCDHCGITFLNEFKLKKHLSHLQNSSKTENIDKVSHPYYRYEGSNELPFNSTSKPKNFIFKNKKNKYYKISSNIFKCKSRASALKRSVFIGECATCGFSSSSRLQLKYHLQNKKVRLRLLGVEDQTDKKELAVDSMSSIIVENNIESKNYFTALSNSLLHVIKHKVKGSIIIVKPTKEISWNLSYNLLNKNNLNNCETKIILNKSEHKKKNSGQFLQPLQTVDNNFQTSLNNFMPSIPNNIKFHCCQTCSKSNAVVIANNDKNGALIFKCLYCKTFNHYKNSRIEVANELSFIPNVNKSKISAHTPAGPIYLMGPVVSVGVSNSIVPVQISKCMPLTGDPDLTSNYLSTLQSHSSQYKGTRKKAKKKKIIKHNLTNSQSSSTVNLKKNVIKFHSSPCDNKSENISEKNYLTNSEPTVPENLNENVIINPCVSSCDILEEMKLSLSNSSSVKNINENVSNARIQEADTKNDLAAIKGKRVLSIEELEKLRGYDVDTLLNYLQN